MNNICIYNDSVVFYYIYSVKICKQTSSIGSFIMCRVKGCITLEAITAVYIPIVMTFVLMPCNLLDCTFHQALILNNMRCNELRTVAFKLVFRQAGRALDMSRMVQLSGRYALSFIFDTLRQLFINHTNLNSNKNVTKQENRQSWVK